MKRILVCLALIAWSGLASAVVYKWVDTQGKTMYGDHPPDGVRAEVVELYTGHGAHSASAPTRPAPNNTPANKGAALLPPGAPDSNTQKTVQEDVAAVREKQCTDAQARYKTLIEGRRLYKTGENGERQYMTAEEIDSERLNAKRDLDAVCNSTT